MKWRPFSGAGLAPVSPSWLDGGIDPPSSLTGPAWALFLIPERGFYECRENWHGTVKLVAEYLADALKFEQLAAQEKDEDLKLSLLQQAAAYRKLAEKRAKELGKSVSDTR